MTAPDDRRVGRVDYLVQAIGAAIVRGDHEPGTTLPVESDLGASFGAGRNAVREAIKVLAGKGFLRTERRAGTIVQPRAQWAMLDPDVLAWMLGDPAGRTYLLQSLSELRRIVEPEAAALAARKASATQVLRLLEAYELMALHRRDREKAIESDILFHERLLDASQNALLSSMSRSIVVLLRANFALSIERKDGFIRNLEQHGKVADAIRRQDPERARGEMMTLLQNNDEDLVSIMRAAAGG